MPARDAGRPSRLLVALHGYGATPGMLEPSVRSVRGDAACLLPRAPFPVRNEPEGTVGYAWMVSAKGKHDAQGRRLSEGLVLRAMEAAAPDVREPAILGFSQGAFLALTAGLTNPGRFHGVIAVGGWVNPEVAADLLRARPRIEVVLVHGTDDDRVPISRAEEALRILSDAGVSARLVPTPGGHRFGRETLHAVREILAGWWGPDGRGPNGRGPDDQGP